MQWWGGAILSTCTNMIFLFKEKQRDPYALPFRSVPKPNIDDILKGRVVDAKKVMQNNIRRRKEYAEGNRGFTRGKTMKHIGDIPMEVYFHPELGKYFKAGADAHERKKERQRFFQKYPQFAV